jgi:hypothetical protein
MYALHIIVLVTSMLTAGDAALSVQCFSAGNDSLATPPHSPKAFTIYNAIKWQDSMQQGGLGGYSTILVDVMLSRDLVS